MYDGLNVHLHPIECLIHTLASQWKVRHKTTLFLGLGFHSSQSRKVYWIKNKISYSLSNLRLGGYKKIRIYRWKLNKNWDDIQFCVECVFLVLLTLKYFMFTSHVMWEGVIKILTHVKVVKVNKSKNYEETRMGFEIQVDSHTIHMHHLNICPLKSSFLTL